MANQDRVNFVWAESALTTIPPIPVSEVAYRDTTQTPEQMEVGQQYDTIYNSARHNQLLFLLTSVAKTLCENGIMPFLAGQEYSQYARCIFTDGKLYTASRAILANEQPYPTPGDDSGVWTAEETGENLVPNSRRVIAGTGLTGGGPLSADVTLAAKLTDSVNLADSKTAASAKAVKATYALAADAKQKSNRSGIADYANGLRGIPLQWVGRDASPEFLLGRLGQEPFDAFQPMYIEGVGSAKAWKAQNSGGNYVLYDEMLGENPTHIMGYALNGIFKIYTTSALSVNYANSAGSAPANGGTSWATSVMPNVAFVGRNGAIPNGGTWLYIYIPYDSHYLRGVTLAGGATAPSNDGGIAIRVA